MTDADSVDRGSNPRLPASTLMERSSAVAASVLQTGGRGFDPHRSNQIWERSQIGKALVLQTRNYGFESRRFHCFFRMWDSGCPPVLGTGLRRFKSCRPDFLSV